jgi:hydrocephalus-inducing protein
MCLTLQAQSSISVDQPLFQPFPPEVVFHNYEPFQAYEAVLRLRNNDKVCVAPGA